MNFVDFGRQNSLLGQAFTVTIIGMSLANNHVPFDLTLANSLMDAALEQARVERGYRSVMVDRTQGILG